MTNVVTGTNPLANVLNFVGTPLVFPRRQANRLNFFNPATNVFYYSETTTAVIPPEPEPGPEPSPTPDPNPSPRSARYVPVGESKMAILGWRND